MLTFAASKHFLFHEVRVKHVCPVRSLAQESRGILQWVMVDIVFHCSCAPMSIIESPSTHLCMRVYVRI